MAKLGFEAHFENIMETLFMMGTSIFGVSKSELERALGVSLRTCDRYVAFLKKHFPVDESKLNGEKRFYWNRSGFRPAVLKIAEERGHNVPDSVFKLDW